MLSPSNPKIPKSIRYHIADIYIDELDKILPLESAEQDFQEVVAELVKPFVKIKEEGVDKWQSRKPRSFWRTLAWKRKQSECHIMKLGDRRTHLLRGPTCGEQINEITYAHF
jgi:(p)ppGpp synthase/HD superfamily hydrolase